MGFDITCVDNVDLLRGLMSKKAVAFSQGVVHGIQQGTLLLYKKDRELINEEIYSKGVPTKAQVAQYRATGKWKGALSRGKVTKKFAGSNAPAWRRTNALRMGERYRVDDLTGTISNETTYTFPRHELNRPGALGITRRAPWRADTVAQAGQAAKDKFVAVLKAEMNG